MNVINRRVVRVFVSPPGDVAEERAQLAAVVQELNTTLGALVPDRPITVELLRFETHVHPDVGNGPQDVINQQMGDYEIFLGIMWSRFGTPTPTAGSGTEEELRAAYRGWAERRMPSHILFYFSEASIPAHIARENADQLVLVHRFREELLSAALVGSYESRTTFADTVRPDLVRVVSAILHGDQASSQIAQRAAAGMPAADRESVRQRIGVLADEYETTRAAMQPGDARTRRLEVVVSTMRSLAQAAFGFLPDLTHSASPGRRLVAITVLQVIPTVDYITWLAERMVVEKPFVAYHAAVALLAAARTLPETSLDVVAAGVAQAREGARNLRRDSDRDVTLRRAEVELVRRRSHADGRS